MDLTYNLMLYLFFGILFTSQAQDSNFFNQNQMRLEPYQVQPSGLESERKLLMYPFDRNDFITELGIVKPVHHVSLPCRLPFFGFDYSYMMVHKDGYITFNRGLVGYDFPIEFPIHVSDPLREEDPSLIAPWLSQQDIPRGVEGAGVYFRIVDLSKESNITLRERILRDFREGMIGANQFTARYVMIVTWKNVTFANPQPHRPLKTNTYQAVIATDEKNTYAMFNYEWISWITHMDNYDGMKGPQSYVGFNAGNMTRSFEFKPYSQHPHIVTMVDRGFGNGIKGRFIFQIDEEIYSGSCIDRDMDPNWNDRPLSFFPRYGSMLGGTLVNITGPCIPKHKKTITVKFDYKNVECVVRDENHATCISPPLMYHGYIDLSTGIDDKSFFHHGRFYIQPPDSSQEDLIVSADKDREMAPEVLDLSWNPFKMHWNRSAEVKFHLWGYRETSDRNPELTYITELVSGSIPLNASSYKLQVKQFQNRNDRNKTDMTFGFISMNLTNSTVLGQAMTTSPIFWSRPMPLAWYFKPQWDREFGTNMWRDYQCLQWYQKELHRDRFAHTVPRCPCTKQQAELEKGRFQPVSECNDRESFCDTLHRGAQSCFMSARASVEGAGQMCCYTDEGELLQTADTMFGGRPSRAFKYGKHPYRRSMTIPTLSHWAHDVMPFFVCCKWNPEGDNSDTCEKFKSQRTSQDCSAYSSPGVGSVYGDPHFSTFDRVNYTFNGKGEFVLARVEDTYHRMDIQARFEKVSKRSFLDPDINGTVLKAIAARDNLSSVVEFRLRPSSARWRFQLYVLVDKEYVFFWDKSVRTQSFRGVTLVQQLGTWNMSHIVAKFDSGVGVEVESVNGYMSANVFLPTTYKGKTRGLLGNWSEFAGDDFATPAGVVHVTSKNTSRQIYQLFGQHWRVTEEERANVSASLFLHDSLPFAAYDDPSFEPEFGNPPTVPANFSFPLAVVDQVCGGSAACRYDFIVTGNRDLASVTKKQEQAADRLAQETRVQAVRCPALPRPRFGRKSSHRNFVGTEVQFSCDDDYQLVGAEYRSCQTNGQWTWGLDSRCIVEDRRQ